MQFVLLAGFAYFFIAVLGLSGPVRKSSTRLRFCLALLFAFEMRCGAANEGKGVDCREWDVVFEDAWDLFFLMLNNMVWVAFTLSQT